MIKHLDDTATIVEFGTGDVGMWFGGDKDTGNIRFYQKDPGEIIGPDINNLPEKGIEKVNLRDYPVSFLFNDVKSIDVLIQVLKVIKKEMLQK